MFGVAAAPAALFLIMLFGIPRSPRWLATQNRVDEARSVLQMMGSHDAEGELREIVDSIHLERSQTAEPLFSWKYRLPIFLAITIGLFNQLAGINAILYYLNDIFAAAGFTKVSGELGPVAVGAMNLCATLLAMTVIDKLGRHLPDAQPSKISAVAFNCVHRVFCYFAGRCDLGLHRRSFSKPGAR
jgi:hypothetical protein